MFATKHIWVTNDSMLLFFYDSQWCPRTVQLRTFFQIFFLCVQQNNDIYTSLEQFQGE